MKIVLDTEFCQNLSKFKEKIKESRRETGWIGEDSQPLRRIPR